MSEAEWAACDDPVRMLNFLGSHACDRNPRLFGRGSVRHVVLDGNRHDGSRELGVAGRCVDGESDPGGAEAVYGLLRRGG